MLWRQIINFMLLLHHPVWVEEEYKERKRTFNRACDREKKYKNKHKQHQQQQKQKQTKTIIYF